MLERQVDARCQKRRSKDQQDTLYLKTDIIVGIVAHHDAATIADTFCQAAQTHCGHVGPCLVPDAQDELDDRGEAEEAGEESVDSEIRCVAIECAFNRTFWSNRLAPFRYSGTR